VATSKRTKVIKTETLQAIISLYQSSDLHTGDINGKQEKRRNSAFTALQPLLDGGKHAMVMVFVHHVTRGRGLEERDKCILPHPRVTVSSPAFAEKTERPL